MVKYVILLFQKLLFPMLSPSVSSLPRISNVLFASSYFILVVVVARLPSQVTLYFDRTRPWTMTMGNP